MRSTRSIATLLVFLLSSVGGAAEPPRPDTLADLKKEVETALGELGRARDAGSSEAKQWEWCRTRKPWSRA